MPTVGGAWTAAVRVLIRHHAHRQNHQADVHGRRERCVVVIRPHVQRPGHSVAAAAPGQCFPQRPPLECVVPLQGVRLQLRKIAIVLYITFAALLLVILYMQSVVDAHRPQTPP